MIVHIDKNKTISSLQQNFNSFFPFLKIEFFTKSHEKGKPTAAKYLVNVNKSLGECGLAVAAMELDIRPDMTVFNLEKLFEDKFGLYIQVFRKSGRIWLETTATDDWTLHSQNEQGKELSEGSQDKGEFPDYHEQE